MQKQDHGDAGVDAAALKQDHGKGGGNTATLKQDHVQGGADAAALQQDRGKVGVDAAALEHDPGKGGGNAATLKQDHVAVGNNFAAVQRAHDQGVDSAATLKQDHVQGGADATALQQDRGKAGVDAAALEQDHGKGVDSEATRKKVYFKILNKRVELVDACIAPCWDLTATGLFPEAGSYRPHEFFGKVTEEVAFRVQYWHPVFPMSWQRVSWVVLLRDSPNSDVMKLITLEIAGDSFELACTAATEWVEVLSELFQALEDWVKAGASGDLKRDKCLESTCAPLTEHDSRTLEYLFRARNKGLYTAARRKLRRWLLQFVKNKNWAVAGDAPEAWSLGSESTWEEQ